MYVMLEDVKNVALHCRLENGLQRMVTFSPGKNQLDKKLWQALVKENAQRFEAHFKGILRPFETAFDTGCRAHLFDYTEAEMLEIIENVHSVTFLEYLLHLERERKIDYAPRSAVIAALLAKIPKPEPSLAEVARLNALYKEAAAECTTPIEEEK